MMVPKSIVLMGETIKIKYCEHMENHGEFHLSAMEIHINADDSPHLQWKSFIHECTHAILSMGGLATVLGKKNEEAICEAMEHMSSLVTLKKNGSVKWGKP